MHAEHILVSRETLQALSKQQGKAIIPIGTTSMRTLESLYWIACMVKQDIHIRQIHLPQWFPYDQPDCEAFSANEALQWLINYLDHHSADHLAASTSLMIAPGYNFRMTHGLITNFHQPGSTLLLLVAALAGEGWKEAYRFALGNNFRFLSYGDSCLFLPKKSSAYI
jgi:S-adenosylmethionine:tRNA ribosyltransferase-isomerase